MVTTSAWPIAPRSRRCWHHCAISTESSTPRNPSPDPKRYWPTYHATPIPLPGSGLFTNHERGIAISNSRLIRFDTGSVTFKVKNYRVNGAGRHTTMTLKINEFIRRFLMHVLPKSQHRIRHYGFFGNGNRAANVARIREPLGDQPPNRKDTSEGENDQSPRILALRCPCCGGRLIIVDTFAPAQHPRAPPTSARAAA